MARPVFLAFALAALGSPTSAATFGLSEHTEHYTIDTGAGLVFQIRRVDHGSNTQSPGDLMSLRYKGVEYQNQSRGSHINSGFDWIYDGTSQVSVMAKQVDSRTILAQVMCGDPASSKRLMHYYIARRGEPRIYMATIFSAEPENQSLARYIVRIPSEKLGHAWSAHTPEPSDIRHHTGPVESKDIFGMADGTTRSKHYSNLRLKDWQWIGAVNDRKRPTVGVWIVRDNHEGGSGGPFYRSLLNQVGSDQEITYIINYGQSQTEAYRMNVLNQYTLVFTDGGTPGKVDASFLASLNLEGYVPAAGRGKVLCPGVKGRDNRYDYTVVFSNDRAQYWADLNRATGAFLCEGMLPGTYEMKLFKHELAVAEGQVTVAAGQSVRMEPPIITDDPSRRSPLWRLGDWDGTPEEFLHADKVAWMHPSDIRITGGRGPAAWMTPPFVIGQSTAAKDWPCYQWKSGVNSELQVKFQLREEQRKDSLLRIGLTTAYAGGRPNIAVNSWTNAKLPPPSPQPKSRTLTTGSWRGNNATFTYHIPASALKAGTNTLTIFPVSGSGGDAYLSPGYSFDCLDMLQDEH